ncbi:MAG: 50S ribosomal protein L20 [Anaerococcus vaginalis]|uniref:50S ribosomal protein L20 n=1 Tax=Anaerococcus jeddahensis TaxID=1673719 RepID=UPI00067253FB|nr:50S ribosomal protein L20 [Anaerococcus jeddahensis]KXA00482.1 ribosomal protein L20 [Anaerococcus hydrogenalis]MDU2829432.1 50S ribosomal protein L20 [Anaerococcus sp.]MDU5912667.1 50S ribosomal protein L20 [Anaerococcus vaginalis]MDU6065142.1 50S ribosomal protein L20 [Anaerococcus sp.]
MARVKRALNAKKRHKKVLKQAKGYYGSKSLLFKTANQAVMKSLQYAFIGRKRRKRDFRKLWIARINAAARANGTSYSKLMGNLKKANIDINRKMLAEIAVSNPEEFTKLVEIANQAA